MTYVRASDGTRIHYRVTGRPGAPPILFIQGLGADKNGWNLQRIASAPSYQAVALDNRGAGRSDKPHGEYSLEQMAIPNGSAHSRSPALLARTIRGAKSCWQAGAMRRWSVESARWATMPLAGSSAHARSADSCQQWAGLDRLRSGDRRTHSPHRSTPS